MNKKIVVATTNANVETPFTVENLQEFADTCIGCPILMNFDQYHPIGEICAASVKDGKLVVEAYISDEAVWITEKMVACTGYTSDVAIDVNSDKYKISNVKAQCVGIVFKADDDTLPPFT